MAHGKALFLQLVTASAAYDVGAIYFGDWHVEPRNEPYHGNNWTEWPMVFDAKPRFEGHMQPNIPLDQPGWGPRYPENVPANMEIKINAAAANGIDFFLFDWYWYAETMPKPYLQGALEDGFLKASNSDKLEFALMWANQDWVDVHPAKLGWHATGRKNDVPDRNMLLIYNGFMNASVYEAAFEYVTSTYFTKSNYYKLPTKLSNGTTADCCFFSFYLGSYLMEGLGGVENVKTALAKFRSMAAAQGQCVHISVMTAGLGPLDNPTGMGLFDSASDYGCMKLTATPFPEGNYSQIVKECINAWSQKQSKYSIPYLPNMSVGWDPSPRCVNTDPFGNFGYPWGGSFRSTPAEFQSALESSKAFLKSRCGKQHEFLGGNSRNNNTSFCPPLIINAWNEWSESAYLEPDERDGFGKLNAIKAVFGNETNTMRF
eukprot:m.71386 g.71386  ORF g.71386 m.71386 type:complete len:430 (+) comp20159_c0_seq5:10-1299(+)